MSSARYLEIDSTYRNRERYPDPASFTVLISQSGMRDNIHAFDPVSDAAPIKTWTPIDFLTDTILGGTVGIGHIVENPSNTSERFILHFPIASNLSKLLDYYIGQPIEVGGYITNITSWEYSSTFNIPSYNNCFWVTVSPSLGATPLITDDIKFKLSTDIHKGIFYIPDSASADSFYTSSILWNESKQEGFPINTYDGDTHLIGIDTSINNNINTWNITETLSIRKIAPELAAIGLSSGSTTNSVILPTIASNTNGIYVGSFIKFTSGLNSGITCRILAYQGLFQPSVVGPPFIPAIPARQALVNCSLNPITSTDKFEILQFSRDNEVPFTYTGSTVSQQETVCYEIQLVNLVLPNKILSSGGKIAFYPYVYVELQNISTSCTPNIIYSNNPNSTRRLFRAIISDISNPNSTPFIKISGNGMVQTIKFKPNDSFKFGVYLPTGEILDTLFPELLSPSSPNPLIQISALFSLKRL
jgi:hypothetical protein